MLRELVSEAFFTASGGGVFASSERCTPHPSNAKRANMAGAAELNFAPT